VSSICNKDLLCIENRGCDCEEGFSTGVDMIKVRPKITFLDHIPQSISHSGYFSGPRNPICNKDRFCFWEGEAGLRLWGEAVFERSARNLWVR